MHFLPARLFWGIVSVFLVVFFVFSPAKIFAQTPTLTVAPAVPTPTGMVGLSAQWAFDPETTEVGKNADRGRQLLWWVFSHPPVHWAPVLAEVWAFSRNIVYVFIVLVLVAMGLGMILSRRGTIGPVFSGISSPVAGTNIVNIFFKLVMILLYVTFSYLIILGMIQFSEVTMRFFIENVGGKDLFNVIFYGAGNSEANYTTFIGYRDINPVNQEMANQSLFLIRTTSLTYNIMSVILILRTIILWFLLIISPFLVLLMPFIFIRNTGWIWIGVFFQWLFYGPLLALFLATLTRIWVAGIPYQFNFSRVNKPEGQIYRTAINILYGGPAQTLGPGNTANYVDTYAEYVIALVMLWAAIILPWWLLRIFRDYCCGLIASSNATLTSILDRMRQFPLPSPPSPAGPSTTTGMATELPFRTRIEERIKEYQQKKVEEYREITKESSVEIAKSIGMSVSSLSDVSRMEMDRARQSQITSELNKIASPERIASPAEREKYMGLRAELKTRAASGDSAARTILEAGKGETGINSQIEMINNRSQVSASARMRTAFAPTITTVAGSPVSSIVQSNISNISKQVGVAEAKVREVISTVQSLGNPVMPSVSTVSMKTGIEASKVREVLERVSSANVISDTETLKLAKQYDLTETQVRGIVENFKNMTITNNTLTSQIAQKTAVSSDRVKEVLDRVVTGAKFTESETGKLSKQLEISETKIRDIVESFKSMSVSSIVDSVSIAQKTGVSAEKVKEVLSRVQSVTTEDNSVKNLSKTVGLSEEKIREIVNLIPVTNLTPSQIARTVAEKTGVPLEKVKEIMSVSVSATSAADAQARKEAVKAHITGAVPAKMAGQTVQSQVSVEDYEEVKNMWLKHYREAPVPVSETIRDRVEWIGTEQTRLTNIFNLISSSDIRQKQKGLESVAEILPFMLLGGFSDTEITTYIKAKLEAAKEIDKEFSIASKAKEEAMKEKEKEEEELVEVSAEKKEEKKAMAEEGKMEMPVAREKKDEKPDSANNK